MIKIIARNETLPTWGRFDSGQNVGKFGGWIETKEACVFAAALRDAIAADGEAEFAAAAAAMPKSSVFSKQFSVNVEGNVSNMANLCLEISITSR